LAGLKKEAAPPIASLSDYRRRFNLTVSPKRSENVTTATSFKACKTPLPARRFRKRCSREARHRRMMDAWSRRPTMLSSQDLHFREDKNWQLRSGIGNRNILIGPVRGATGLARPIYHGALLSAGGFRKPKIPRGVHPEYAETFPIVAAISPSMGLPRRSSSGKSSFHARPQQLKWSLEGAE